VVVSPQVYQSDLGLRLRLKSILVYTNKSIMGQLLRVLVQIRKWRAFARARGSVTIANNTDPPSPDPDNSFFVGNLQRSAAPNEMLAVWHTP
jgi:hypothetical protein